MEIKTMKNQNQVIEKSDTIDFYRHVSVIFTTFLQMNICLLDVRSCR